MDLSPPMVGLGTAAVLDTLCLVEAAGTMGAGGGIAYAACHIGTICGPCQSL